MSFEYAGDRRLELERLSVSVALPGIVWRELVTGLAVGTGLALVAAPLMLWRWGAPGVTLVLALSLVSTCAVATVIAIAAAVLR